jgi:regulator of protease activity HflC (stomatin/prohibitin superfamily)
MSTKSIISLICGGVLFVALLIASLITVKFASVKGNEMGVRETWFGGVDDNPLFPGTHLLIPGWTNTVYTYDMSSQIFVMKDFVMPDEKELKAKGKQILAGKHQSFHVQSSEGQDMAISMNVRWRIDPAKLIHLHKTVRSNFEDKVLGPVIMRVVKDEATMRKAIEAYSGDGLVKLQQDIQKDLLAANGELAKSGIIVENFVIEGIKLDDSYIGEIRARQVATQKKLRSDEETKAAEAEALRMKAVAQADLNTKVVQAERDRQVYILKIEQETEGTILTAKAEAEKTMVAVKAEADRLVKTAESQKQADLFKAQAIEALGKAEAEATRLKLTAYGAAGSDNYTKIQVAESMGKAFSGIKGYLPADMKVHVISENFMKSLDSFMRPAASK